MKKVVLALSVLFSVRAHSVVVVKVIEPKAADYAVTQQAVSTGGLSLLFTNEAGNEAYCFINAGQVHDIMGAKPWALAKEFSSDKKYEVLCDRITDSAYKGAQIRMSVN
jgi:hypothetical protein